jgi:glycogen phosphorylase
MAVACIRLDYPPPTRSTPVNPEQLRGALVSLATNLRWTWNHRTTSVFADLPTADHSRHPLRSVRALDDDDLRTLCLDADWCAHVASLVADLESELATAVTDPEVVYYSPEFGISELVPQYSGGLGILAGDHLKAASDLGVQLAAVGLFYRHGFFRQQIGPSGQSERIDTYDAVDLGCIDTGAVVEVPIATRTVLAKVWRLDVGRIPLLVLDTDIADNSPADRLITDQLYSGDRRHRLEQELVLGVGGARAVAALGWNPGIHHLNEGHAGFLTLELVDRALADGAESLDAAIDVVRPHLLFTTHTPVPAGIDRFDRKFIERHLEPWADRWNTPIRSLLALGEDPDSGIEVFNMAALCLRMADRANGVSELHGEVSQELFARVPGGDRIGSVTNGVHARTWVSPPLQELFDGALGCGWTSGDPGAWSGVHDLTDEQLVTVRRDTRGPLERLLADRSGVALEPGALVIGFARRFATYKRATMLLRHPEVLAALLAADDCPVHFVFAGKAHPADEPGKALLADIVAHASSPAANARFTFLPDYDMAVARAMYAGCDVWLNTPVRPHEASGTSGEKAALNGALNCSIRDGWWAEMSDGRNGWDIALSTATDPQVRDDEESASLLALLGEIAEEFHADGTGRPSAEWLARVRHNWATLGPRVTSARMVTDYREQYYEPMLSALRTG